MKNEIKLKIYRVNTELSHSSHWNEFTLEYDAESVLLDLLLKIFNEQDNTLAFDKNCRIGLCSSCRVKVNEKIILACSENVAQFVAELGDVIEVSPYNTLKSVRDLVVDPQFESCTRIKVTL